MNVDQLELLKQKLNTAYVPHLPPLLSPKSEEENAKKNCSRAYPAFALAKLLRLDEETAAGSVVDDYDDNGIDAIFYHQNARKIYVVQGKLKTSDAFKREDATNFITGIRDLCNQNYGRFNKNIRDRQQELEDAFDDADEIILVVAHLSDKLTEHAIAEFEHFLQVEARDLDVRLRTTIEDYSAKRALEGFLGEKAVVPIDAGIFITGDREIAGAPKTWYGQVSVKSLADLYEKHGNMLFEKNIRYFLGVTKSDVNRSIANTLDSAPESFFYLNNGITALAQRVSPKANRDGKRAFQLKQLSIINGAQTIASCHHYMKANPGKDISAAKVMITLIEVDEDKELSKSITRARNHQNAVDASHFAALDGEQERLRRELDHMNIIYRYRPEAATPAAQDIISVDEAAVALALFNPAPQMPSLLKQEIGTFTNPQSDNYKKLFTTGLSGKQLVNAVRLYRAANQSLLSNEIASAGEEKIIYRHSRYAVLWLLFNANSNWIKKDISDDAAAGVIVSHDVDAWRERVRAAVVPELRASYKGALAFFRSQTYTQPFLVRLRTEGLNYNIPTPVATIGNDE